MTRLKLGQLGARTSPAAEAEDPETQPESNESPLPDLGAPARKGRPRGTRKPAAGSRKTATVAKRAPARRKKTAS